MSSVVDSSRINVNGPGPAPLAVGVAVTFVTDQDSVLVCPSNGTFPVEEMVSAIVGLAGGAMVTIAISAAVRPVGPVAVKRYLVVIVGVGDGVKLRLVVPSLLVDAPDTVVHVAPLSMDCSSNCVNGPLPEPKPQLRVVLSVPPP